LQRFAIFITLMWVIGCSAVLLILAGLKGELSPSDFLVFVYFGIAAPSSCWFIYWLILGYKWGIYSKLLGSNGDEKNRNMN
jgi:hypothetical protein